MMRSNPSAAVAGKTKTAAMPMKKSASSEAAPSLLEQQGRVSSSTSVSSSSSSASSSIASKGGSHFSPMGMAANVLGFGGGGAKKARSKEASSGSSEGPLELVPIKQPPPTEEDLKKEEAVIKHDLALVTPRDPYALPQNSGESSDHHSESSVSSSSSSSSDVSSSEEETQHSEHGDGEKKKSDKKKKKKKEKKKKKKEKKKKKKKKKKTGGGGGAADPEAKSTSKFVRKMKSIIACLQRDWPKGPPRWLKDGYSQIAQRKETHPSSSPLPHVVTPQEAWPAIVPVQVMEKVHLSA